MAAAEYGLNPECYIYEMPNKKLISKFKMNTTIKTEGMAFSRDGMYLLMIGSLPDFRISIFNLETGKMLLLPEEQMPCDQKDFQGCQFNPKTKDVFAIYSTNAVYFYKLKNAFQKVSSSMEGDDDEEKQDELVDAYRFERQDFEPEDAEVEMHSFKWDAYQRLHVCTNKSQLMLVDSKTAKQEQVLTLPCIAETSLLTNKYLIISCEDGMIYWYKLDEPQVDDADPCLKIFDEVEKEYNFAEEFKSEDAEKANFMHYSRSFRKIIIGTRSGIIGKLAVEAENINYEEDEEDQQDDN